MASFSANFRYARLLQKLLLERAIFRFVGHPLKLNGKLKIFREHFHVRQLLRYQVPCGHNNQRAALFGEHICQNPGTS